LTPLYGSMPQATRREVAKLPPLAALPEARIVEAELPGGVPALLLDCPRLYERPGGPYQDATGAEWPDNAQRFAQLARAAAFLAGAGAGWAPEIVHANDWQGALAPAYLREASIGAAS